MHTYVHKHTNKSHMVNIEIFIREFVLLCGGLQNEIDKASVINNSLLYDRVGFHYEAI